MKHSMPSITHYCGNCKQELPIQAFYISPRTERPDNYCKECRKKISREQRKNNQSIQTVENRRDYPVITEIKDNEQRKQLLRHSLQIVAENIERKRKKYWEEKDE